MLDSNFWDFLRKKVANLLWGRDKKASPERTDYYRLLCFDLPVNLVWTCHSHYLDATSKNIYRVYSLTGTPLKS